MEERITPNRSAMSNMGGAVQVSTDHSVRRVQYWLLRLLQAVIYSARRVKLGLDQVLKFM